MAENDVEFLEEDPQKTFRFFKKVSYSATVKWLVAKGVFKSEKNVNVTLILLIILFLSLATFFLYIGLQYSDTSSFSAPTPSNGFSVTPQ